MARFFACRTFSQNFLFGGKDQLAGAALNKDNNTPAMSHAATPATIPPVFSALSSAAQYLENDFQRILMTVFDFRTPAFFWTPAPAPQ